MQISRTAACCVSLNDLIYTVHCESDDGQYCVIVIITKTKFAQNASYPVAFSWRVPTVRARVLRRMRHCSACTITVGRWYRTKKKKENKQLTVFPIRKWILSCLANVREVSAPCFFRRDAHYPVNKRKRTGHIQNNNII